VVGVAALVPAAVAVNRDNMVPEGTAAHSRAFLGTVSGGTVFAAPGSAAVKVLVGRSVV
jgi:hypothetical protein